MPATHGRYNCMSESLTKEADEVTGTSGPGSASSAPAVGAPASGTPAVPVTVSVTCSSQGVVIVVLGKLLVRS